MFNCSYKNLNGHESPVIIIGIGTLAGLAPIFTVDTVTIIRHGLNFARCIVSCLLL